MGAPATGANGRCHKVAKQKSPESRNNLTFIHHIEGDLPEWIETDPLRLRPVLNNLLGNAMKFTVRGEVTLGVCVASDLLRFEVKDTGKGIPAADLPSLFKPFYQAANNQLIEQGVGLGLHISRQIVDLLGGKISVVSEPDQGSTFTFEKTVPQSRQFSAKSSSDDTPVHGTNQSLFIGKLEPQTWLR